MLSEVRIAVRSLAKTPGFTVAAVLTLAAAIAASSALFSALRQFVLQPVSLPEPQRLLHIWSRNVQRNTDNPTISWPRAEAIRKAQTSCAVVAVSTFEALTLTGAGEPTQLTLTRATPEFLEAIGVKPMLGRNLSREESIAGGANAILLGHTLWRTRFGGREDVVGTTIRLGGGAYQVVGVLPPLSRPFAEMDGLIGKPLELTDATPQQIQSGVSYFEIYARLRPGVTLEQANAELRSIAANDARAQPARTDAENVNTYHEVIDDVAAEIRPAFHALLGAVVAVLLIACANVSNLMLSRFSARQTDTAVRVALGATRGQVVRQFLTESVLVSTVAGALGMAGGAGALGLARQVAAAQLPVGVDLRFDVPAAVCAVALALGCALVVGAWPAWNAAARANLADALKSGARDSGGGVRGRRFRSVLVVVEVMLATVLLVGTLLLLASFQRLERRPIGYVPDGIGTALVNLPPQRYATRAEQCRFFEQVVQELARQPGVAAATYAYDVPMSGFAPTTTYTIEGEPVRPAAQRAIAGFRIVGIDYFHVLRQPLRAGRVFSAQDREGAPGVCVVSEAFARRLFPDGKAIGRALLTGKNGENRCEIVGIVGDVLTKGPKEPPPDEIYYPVAQRGRGAMTIIAQLADANASGAARDPAALQAVLRRAVASVDAQQAISYFYTLEFLRDRALGGARLVAVMTSIFSVFSVGLAVVGIYAVLAFMVTQRTTEIGVRMALGASRGQIVELVLGGGLRLVGVGVLLGLVGAMATTQAIRGLLVDVPAMDVATYLEAAALFGIVALAACLVPALRASRVNPVVALRNE